MRIYCSMDDLLKEFKYWNFEDNPSTEENTKFVLNFRELSKMLNSVRNQTEEENKPWRPKKTEQSFAYKLRRSTFWFSFNVSQKKVRISIKLFFSQFPTLWTDFSLQLVMHSMKPNKIHNSGLQIQQNLRTHKSTATFEIQNRGETERRNTFWLAITDPERHLKPWSEMWLILLEILHQLSTKNLFEK